MSEKAAKVTASLVAVLAGGTAAFFLYGAAKAAAAAGPFAPAALAAYAAAATAVGVTLAGMYGAYEGFSMSSPAVGGIGEDFDFAGDTQGFEMGEAVNDAIIQNNGQMTKITPINKQDEIMAVKPGGPIAATMGATGGNQVPDRLIEALERVAMMLEKPSDKDINITVELDKRKMGQAVVSVVDKKLAIT